MKITLFLCLFGIFGVQASTYSQNTKLNLDYKNTSIKQILADIKTQSKFEFIYNNDDFDTDSKVDISVNEGSVEEVLDIIILPAHLQYSVVDKMVIISMANKEAGSNAQQQPIKGKVVDGDGKPLPGVTIIIVGTTRGVITDGDGNYSIVAAPTDKLVFSFVGMESQVIEVGDQNTIKIKLKENTESLEEVTIVAFGKQKKESVIGSITTIKPAELKIPSSNLTTALAGKVAGLISYQRSGEPGQDNGEFFIRGVTTFGYKTSPLILIDGMELTTTDLARLQPDDISSFSIMKDATSSALYGARGANGVILVTTKQGAIGKAKLSFRIENSISAPTQNIELADPITYMRLANEATLTRDPLGVLPYSDEKIANTLAGVNPIVYPANNWKKLIFKDYTMNQRATLNVSGGGGVAKYYVSGSLNKDNGMLKIDKRNNYNNNIDLRNYSLRSNVTIDVTKSTEMIVRLSGNFDEYTGPIDGGKGIYNKVMRSNPVLFPQYYPLDEQHKYVKHIMYGNYQEGGYINPYADLTKGYKDYSRSLMLAQIEVKQDLNALTEGLSFRTMLNTNRSSYFDVSRYYNPYYYTLTGYDPITDKYAITNINEATATEYLGYSEGDKTVASTFYLESMLNYNRTLQKHDFSGLLVYIMRENLNANAGDLQQSLPFRNLGLSGRGTYAYDHRYFVEVNFGYNGSERFAEAKRFGFFPSAGLAWSISSEKFFEKIKPVVTNLKLRGTYGLVGNDAIGSASDRFFYLSNVNMNDAARAATFGNGLGSMYTQNGVTISRYSNPDITWETATKKNIAVELGLFEKLTVIAEYYSEIRENILMTRSSIPITMGLTAPVRANVGEASGQGTDISVDYDQSFNKNLWFSARGNFTYATNKYRVFEEPEYLEKYRSRVGYPINQTFGYIAERLFVDDEEALNSPKQNFGVYGGGDIKYTDVNRDGQITEADRVPIGNPTFPEIVYGFGFSGGYKNFDISAFFQGLANESFWIDANATSPFQNQTQVLKVYADSHWSEDSRDVRALWPRLSTTVNSNNDQRSTWFMRDGSFLRLKQVEIGYTLPTSFQKKIRTSTFRIYVSGSNLLNFSKFKLWDVEMGGNGLGYPIQRVVNLGLNISFN